jgi:hypothetical protein
MSRTSSSIVHSTYTSLVPQERNDRCKFERKAAEFGKKIAPSLLYTKQKIMSTKKQNTFNKLKEIKLHYSKHSLPLEGDPPLTENIP